MDASEPDFYLIPTSEISAITPLIEDMENLESQIKEFQSVSEDVFKIKGLVLEMTGADNIEQALKIGMVNSEMLGMISDYNKNKKKVLILIKQIIETYNHIVVEHSELLLLHGGILGQLNLVRRAMGVLINQIGGKVAEMELHSAMEWPLKSDGSEC